MSVGILIESLVQQEIYKNRSIHFWNKFTHRSNCLFNAFGNLQIFCRGRPIARKLFFMFMQFSVENTIIATVGILLLEQLKAGY